ncbi:MAG: hypothetical protein MJ106_04375, partial [Lentisphaeria bacterium]|nr:hypothetical protein [Lentisphaeria bacterium]
KPHWAQHNAAVRAFTPPSWRRQAQYAPQAVATLLGNIANEKSDLRLCPVLDHPYGTPTAIGVARKYRVRCLRAP